MEYIEVTIEASEEALERVTGALLMVGINETVVDNPGTAVEILSKKNSYDWDYVDDDFVDMDAIPTIKFYLEKTEENQALAKKAIEKVDNLKNIFPIEAKSGKLGPLSSTLNIIDDKDWMNSYKEHFKSIKLCEKIMVKPSWENTEAPEGVKILELDPGMAFGTGDHETTSMCATLMEEVSCEEKDILDVGTGSGILAIAASLLGAKNILGVDIDDLAITVAAENVVKNNCEHNITIKKGDLTKGIDFKADIVVANLMAEIVVMLSKAVKKHMKEDAYFISSGILNDKKDMVIKGLNDSGLEVVKVLDRGDWSAILAK